MSRLENLSNEVLMIIFEYMNVEDIWTIFFHMNSRFHSLVFDSRLHLTADISKISKDNFDQFCFALIQTNLNNIFTLILSNNYYRYPQIQQFLSHTNFTYFQALCSLTLIDINQEELMEITKQIRNLKKLNHLHINTHEIFTDKQLANVTPAVFNQPNIRVLGLDLHEKIQWFDTETIPLCNIEVLSLNFININRLYYLLSQCPYLRSLSMSLDSRLDPTISEIDHISTFPQITSLRFYFRPFNVSVLERLLNSLPSIKHFSIDTFIYKADYIRAPFWTLLFQQYFKFLERIRLVVRGFDLFKSTNTIELDRYNLIGGYRYDRYWLERTQKKIFTCHTGDLLMVLRIR